MSVAVKEGIFGAPHAITLTNLVVDNKSNTLIGFVYLNSHSRSFGVDGYGFLHAAEAAKYLSDATSVTSITLQKPILSLPTQNRSN